MKIIFARDPGRAEAVQHVALIREDDRPANAGLLHPNMIAGDPFAKRKVKTLEDPDQCRRRLRRDFRQRSGWKRHTHLASLEKMRRDVGLRRWSPPGLVAGGDAPPTELG